jgi:hypothetical protein
MVSPQDRWQLNRTEPQGLEQFKFVPETMKETHGRGYEVTHGYEMRSRKTKLSVDLNKSAIEEEQGMKDRNKEQVLIKTNIEDDKGAYDSHQVDMLKQQIQSLQQQKQDL